MEQIYALFIIGLFSSVVVTAAFALFAWRRRESPVTRAFFWACVTVLLRGAPSVLSAVSATPELAAFWFITVRYVGVALTPVAFMVFALAYAGQPQWLAARRWAPLMVIPVITQLANWAMPEIFLHSATFERYGLFWVQTYDVVGWWFWVHVGYSYALMLISLGVLVWHASQSYLIYRAQAIVIAAGLVFPLAVSTVSVFSPQAGRQDITQLSTVGTLAILAWALFRYRFLDIIPVARSVIVESMDDVVIVLDSENRIVDFNPAARSVMGWTAGTVGKNIREAFAVYPDLVDQYVDAPDVRAEVAIGIGEARRVFDLHISPLYQRPGAPLAGRSVVLRDITARQRVEEERERLIGELDAYAHTVAHDLKAPLALLMGYCQLLEEMRPQMTQDEVDTSLRSIYMAAGKMTRIINELLLLANVRSSEEVPAEPLDMAGIVREAQERLGPMIEEHAAEIVVPTGWPAALGHAPWVEEVWANYLSNAIKYGGRPPRIELGAAPQADGFVRFWVRDNGPGLSAEQQGRLFTEFTRLHKVKAEGHGLGLSIVQRIVHRLGGQAGVESAEGQGSTFYFTLRTKSDLLPQGASRA